jgi:hypothetical protein
MKEQFSSPSVEGRHAFCNEASGIGNSPSDNRGYRGLRRRAQYSGTKLCDTAMSCIQTNENQDASCQFAGVDSNGWSYVAYNNNPSRKIFATFTQTVRHINSEQPPQSNTIMVAVDPYAASTLGCARTKGLLASQFDEWSYTLIAACFSDQCPSPPPSKPSKQRNPAMTCQQLCQSGDASCLRYKVTPAKSPLEAQLADALDQLNNVIYTAHPPVQIKVDGLVNLSNLFTGKNNCARTDLTVQGSTTPDYPFTNSGSTCPIGFSVSRPDVSSIEIDLPGLYSGNMQINLASTSYALVSNLANAPSMLVTETATNTPVLEPITTINGSHGVQSTLTFTGETYYCAEIDWDSK